MTATGTLLVKHRSSTYNNIKSTSHQLLKRHRRQANLLIRKYLTKLQAKCPLFLEKIEASRYDAKYTQYPTTPNLRFYSCSFHLLNDLKNIFTSKSSY